MCHRTLKEVEIGWNLRCMRRHGVIYAPVTSWVTTKAVGEVSRDACDVRAHCDGNRGPAAQSVHRS